jgi:hypothetical protein
MGKRKVTILEPALEKVARVALFIEGEGLPKTAKKFVHDAFAFFYLSEPWKPTICQRFFYYSHSLDFRMMRPTEDIEQFERRISGAEENLNTPYKVRKSLGFLKKRAGAEGQ